MLLSLGDKGGIGQLENQSPPPRFFAVATFMSADIWRAERKQTYPNTKTCK